MARKRQSLSEVKRDETPKQKMKQEELAAAKAQSNLYGVFFGLGIVAVIALGIFFYVTQEQPLPDLEADFDLSSVEDNSVAYENQGQEHLPSGAERAPYNSNPPTSGPHNERWVTPLGVYSQQPDDMLIHNLEHGHVWLSYRDADDAEAIQLLTAIQSKYPDRVIVSYRPENENRVEVAAWTRLLSLNELNRAEIEAFIVRHSDNAPESVMGR